MRANTLKRRRRLEKLKRKRFLKWLFVAGSLLILYSFLLGDYGLYQQWRLRREKNRLIANIEQMKWEQERLKESVKLLEQDYEYIERIAREKYFMAKKWEKIYRMVPRGKKAHD